MRVTLNTLSVELLHHHRRQASHLAYYSRFETPIFLPMLFDAKKETYRTEYVGSMYVRPLPAETRDGKLSGPVDRSFGCSSAVASVHRRFSSHLVCRSSRDRVYRDLSG